MNDVAEIMIDGQLYEIKIEVETEIERAPLGQYCEKLAHTFYDAFTFSFSNAVNTPPMWGAVPEADREVMIAFTSQLVNRFGMPDEVTEALKEHLSKETQ